MSRRSAIQALVTTFVCAVVFGVAAPFVGWAHTLEGDAQRAPTTVLSRVQELICDRNGASVTARFSLPAASPPQDLEGKALPAIPEEIWIDLSLFDNGFAPPTFLGLGPNRAMYQTALISWDGLIPNAQHYFRFNARIADQWYSLRVGSFTTPDCASIVRLQCNTGQPSAVTFAFPYSAPEYPPGFVVIWLDLSIFNNGFATGTFIGGPSLRSRPGSNTTTWWNGIRPGVRHYYRFNSLVQGVGWIAVRSGTFVSLECDEFN